MAIVAISTNLKTTTYLVDDEANDLLDGVAQPYSNLTALTGFTGATPMIGFVSATAGYNSYAYGTIFIARNTSRMWIVEQSSTPAKVLVLLVEGSPAAVSGASLRYVVAEAGTPMAVAGTYPTIAAAITQAVTDRASAAVPVDVLVLPGDYAGFAYQANVHVAALTDGRDTSATVQNVTINSAVTMTAAGAAALATLKGMSLLTGGTTALDTTNGGNYTLTVTQCRVDVGSTGINHVAGTLMVRESEVVSSSGTAITSAAALTLLDSTIGSQLSTNAISTSAALTVTRANFVGSINNTAGAMTFTTSAILADAALGAILVDGTANLFGTSIDNGTNVLTVDGAGTLTLAGGTTGIRTVGSTVTVTVSQPLGASFINQTLTATGTINAQTDYVVAGTFAVAGVLTLPDPDVQLPGKELRIKRIGTDVLSVTVAPTGATQIDNLGAATAVDLNPMDSLVLTADRGNGRWLRTP